MATKPPVASGGQLGGRPYKWPWLSTPIGGTFVLTAASPASLRTTLSRSRRLYGKDYRMVRRMSAGKYVVKRVA